MARGNAIPVVYELVRGGFLLKRCHSRSAKRSTANNPPQTKTSHVGGICVASFLVCILLKRFCLMSNISFNVCVSCAARRSLSVG